MPPSSEEAGRTWFQTGQCVLADADNHLAEDDFDGACRRFLIAAYCFAQARTASATPADRHECQSAFHYAFFAAGPLLHDPDGQY